MKQKFYITTAIPYTSSVPHIGNVYEAILTDAIARFRRMQGYDVFFLTGTDEYGIKIQQKAEENSITPKEYVDRISGKLRGIWDTFGISYNKFIRTTDKEHIEAVQKIFKKLYDQDDIYKDVYEGLYCTPCESFWTESQLENDKCPSCGGPVTKAREEAYFLRLSKYAGRLLEYYDSHPDFIVPVSRKKEMINNFIKPGLQDLCVSRTSFSWGIPVDFDPKHVVYVWLDALSNYITALGYAPDGSSEQFKKLWPADLQVLGKDVIRFHTIYWPIILMALGEPLPKTIMGHPFLMMDNEKMSKSKGNVIYSDDLLEFFTVDEIRYYLLSEMGLQNDGNITYSAVISRTNTHLANIYGNLVSRTVSMIGQYFDGVIPDYCDKTEYDNSLFDNITACAEKVYASMDNYMVADSSEAIIELLKHCNKYIDETTPWLLAKDESKKGWLSSVMANLVEGIRISTTLFAAFMPDTCKKVCDSFGFGDISITPETLKFTYPAAGKTVKDNGKLFRRIDKDEFEKAREAREEEKAKKAEEGKIDISDFAKVSLVVGKILECEEVPKSDKLLKLIVDIGSEKRQVVSGISKFYKPEELTSRKIILVENLKTAKLRGIESQGMILASGEEDVKVVFIDDSVPVGSKVR